MELYLIRHGQSTNNALEDDSTRTYDPELTPQGRQQAARLAEFAVSEANRDPWVNHETGYSRAEIRRALDLTHLYVSPMHRALQTAAPLAEAIGVQAVIRYDVFEHGGVYLEHAGEITPYPGRTRAQILEEFPAFVIGDTHRDDGWYDLEGGRENYAQGCGRAIALAIELRQMAAKTDPDARVGIVTHGTFMDVVIKALFGHLPSRSVFYMHYNTAITRLDFLDRERVLFRYLNRVDHLPADLIT